jgi:hypothetical protein
MAIQNNVELCDTEEKTMARLKEVNIAFPEFFEELASLYNVNIPIYFIPQIVIYCFTDANDPLGYLWHRISSHDIASSKPLAILIANDRTLHKNKSLHFLKTLLHEIGHIKLARIEMDWFTKKFSNVHDPQLLNNREFLHNHAWLLSHSIECRIEQWMQRELKRLKPFINGKRNGWKKGYAFEKLRLTLQYDEEAGIKFATELFANRKKT